MGAAEGADGTLSVSGDTPVCVFPPTRGIPLLFVIQEVDRVETDVGSELAVSPEPENVFAIRDTMETRW